MRTEPDGLRRQRTFSAGRRAERIALLWLSLKGYRVLARRYVVRGGEIDLVMRRGCTVAFVEVKSRPTLDEAIEAVTPIKLRRVNRAVATWVARNSWAAGLSLRCDLVAVAPRRWPKHIENALPLATGT